MVLKGDDQMRHANRGMTFENMIERSIRTYELKGKALIHKRATPMKIISKTRLPNQYIAVFDKKSTVDFSGVYKGRSIEFEAKSTEERTRFELKMVSPEQAKHLESAEKHGSICFLLVEMKTLRTVYLIPGQMYLHYLKKANEGGRKSIPIDELEVYGYTVKSQNGVLLDFLDVVDKVYLGESK